MKSIPQNSILVAALLAMACALPSRADDSTSSVAFSDPTKPGTLKIRVLHGEVVVHGADVKAVSVKSETMPSNPAPRKDGLRVLSTSASYILSEKGNVALLEYGVDGSGGPPADFEVTVPHNTSIVMGSSVHGDFRCENISGDVDVRSLNGDVKLHDISGGALVETTNGDISVDVKGLTPSHLLSFSSMNGRILIHVPADLKAAISFRTHRGTILTNFDDKALVTRTEISRHGYSKKEKTKTKNADGAPEGPQAAVNPAPPVPPSPNSDSDSDESSDNWHDQVRDSVRMAALSAADAARQAAEAVREGMDEARMELSTVSVPGAPLPPLPPMTGGKIVSGLLNGGGDGELQASTLNGDIVLKKAE
jgi:hypothetical protein